MTTIPMPLMNKLMTQNTRKLFAIAICGLGTLSVTTAPVYADDEGSFWTQFVPSVDTRLIFVSSSQGSDTNTGLTPDRPVKTLAKGYELLRDGYPDWMLLKRGDVWQESMPSPTKSGRSADERLIVGAYGSETNRPKITTPSDANGMQAQGDQTLANVAYVGLHLEPESRGAGESPTGIRWLRSCDNVLFEDMYIEGYSVNVVLQAYPESNQLNDIRFNGCVIVDSWSNTGHSQGMFAKGVNGLEVENSVLASNGFNYNMGAEPTIFNHNAYIQNGCAGIVFRNNIIADASSHGIQLRPGGIVENNLFISNPLALLVGGGTGPEPEGVTGIVRNNLIMYGRDISPDLPRAYGFTLSNIREAEVSNNYFNISTIGANHHAITIGGDRALMVRNLDVSHNLILNWEGSITIYEPNDGQIMDNVKVTHNAFYRDLTPNSSSGNLNMPLIKTYDGSSVEVLLAENEYHYYQMHDRPFKVGNSAFDVAEWIDLVEPTASSLPLNSPPPNLGLDTYLGSIEQSGDMQVFIEQARLMSRSNPQFNYSAASVIQWFTTEIGTHNVGLVE